MLNCCYARFWRERWFTNRQEILFIVWTHIWSSVVITVTVCCNTMTSDSAVILVKSSTSFGQTCPFLTGMTIWTAGEWLQQNISLIREIHIVRVLSGGWRTRSTVWGHSVAWVHSNLSLMRYMVGHFLHVFAYIPLTHVQLFIDKPRPMPKLRLTHVRMCNFSQPKVYLREPRL